MCHGLTSNHSGWLTNSIFKSSGIDPWNLDYYWFQSPPFEGWNNNEAKWGLIRSLNILVYLSFLLLLLLHLTFLSTLGYFTDITRLECALSMYFRVA